MKAPDKKPVKKPVDPKNPKKPRTPRVNPEADPQQETVEAETQHEIAVEMPEPVQSIPDQTAGEESVADTEPIEATSLPKRITSLFNYKISKTILVILALALAGLTIYNGIRTYQLRNLERQSQKIKEDVQAGLERVKQSEAGLTDPWEHDRLDSLIHAKTYELSALMEKHQRFEESMRLLNEQYKKENDELQQRIKSSSLTNDDRRRIGRELSGQN